MVRVPARSRSHRLLRRPLDLSASLGDVLSAASSIGNATYPCSELALGNALHRLSSTHSVSFGPMQVCCIWQAVPHSGMRSPTDGRSPNLCVYDGRPLIPRPVRACSRCGVMVGFCTLQLQKVARSELFSGLSPVGSKIIPNSSIRRIRRGSFMKCRPTDTPIPLNMPLHTETEHPPESRRYS